MSKATSKDPVTLWGLLRDFFVGKQPAYRSIDVMIAYGKLMFIINGNLLYFKNFNNYLKVIDCLQELQALRENSVDGSTYQKSLDDAITATTTKLQKTQWR